MTGNTLGHVSPRPAAGASLARDLVTVLFTDIEGFTRLVELLPLERTADILEQYYDTLLSIAEASSGTVDRFVGDGALIYWSRSRNGSDHAALAVSAVLALREALSHGDEAGEARIAGGLPVRFGLHSGEVIIGRFGEGALAESLLGDVVNVASRLQEAAKGLPSRAGDGRVRGYISRETVRHLVPELSPAPFDRLVLRGRRREILARRL